MLEAYRKNAKERESLGLPPLPLNAEQTFEITELAKKTRNNDPQLIKYLLVNRVPPGVDEAAYVKAAFLTDIAIGKIKCQIFDRKDATRFLGTMLGGYNVPSLINLLTDEDVGDEAVFGLSNTLLIFDAFYDIAELANQNVDRAKEVIKSWALGEWFLRKDKVKEKYDLIIFKIPGETNTDDLSPATDAWSRPDIPLHALSMLKSKIDNPLEKIKELKQSNLPLVYVGDVVGTGSSRKSATNSVLWHIGIDIPFVPNKRSGGFCFGGKIAPIFFNTMEDAGALPIECDVSQMEMGEKITVYPFKGEIFASNNNLISRFKLKNNVIFDEVRAGGRIPLIIGKGLTVKAREFLKLPPDEIFQPPEVDLSDKTKSFTLAQKMVGKACGVQGIKPGAYCEPKMTTVGSQDTTGPMTRDELKELACLGFQADLVVQSFCHTAAYPKPVDIETQHKLPDFIMNRGGVSLRPGDGIIHSWMNRMLIPDTVGTGGDSHTRFPMGISFPGGSGLVAFAAATGVMPLDMPESIRVKFHGELQNGVTIRDLVNSIPHKALEKGLLTLNKSNKKNCFSGRILEIEGLPNLTIEQAFELSDASAERSSAGCTIKLNKEPIQEYIRSNITLLNWMIAEGYGDIRTIKRRVRAMEVWLEKPDLLSADPCATYAETLDINLNEITEPLLACPNDPDDIRSLSEVSHTHIDEVFIGSCMTNIGHYRAAGEILKTSSSIKSRMWIAPPTRMDQEQLMEEGYYSIFGISGARTEMPGCSLCMGNQARVADNSTVVSTSTRNFPNRLGKGANVFLASSELTVVAGILGYLPTFDEYLNFFQNIKSNSKEIYKYLNFHQIKRFQDRIALSKIPLVTK